VIVAETREISEATKAAEATDGRRETELERVDRNLTELLAELRIATVGVQVLFAFLLMVPFSSRFDTVSQGERYLYFAILVAAGAATGLLIAPTALHRLLLRLGDKPYLLRFANRMALAGIGCISFAMTGILALISGHLFGWVVGAIVAALAAVFFGGLWFGFGLVRRRAASR
jgi:hypothetical protein